MKLFEMKHIKKNFDGLEVLKDISLDVEEGEVLSIIGPSGSGKSTILRCATGLETPDSGEIIKNGDVGLVFQQFNLFPHFSVLKNIVDAPLKVQKRKKDEVYAQARSLLKKMGLADKEKAYPFQLSGGQQQRTALARIMAYEPEVILLDEPFSALDLYLKDRLEQEVLQMLESYMGTVIMVSHNRDEIYRFSEELFVMDKGRIVASGKTEELFQNPKNKTAAILTGCKNFSSIIYIDDHTVEAKEWGICLKTKRKVPKDAKWIGYRAHDFIPVWGTRGENMLKFQLESSARLPFEQNYYIAAENRIGNSTEKNGEKDKTMICWFVQREKMEEIEKKGFPDYLWIDEGKILFLNE